MTIFPILHPPVHKTPVWCGLAGEGVTMFATPAQPSQPLRDLQAASLVQCTRSCLAEWQIACSLSDRAFLRSFDVLKTTKVSELFVKTFNPRSQYNPFVSLAIESFGARSLSWELLVVCWKSACVFCLWFGAGHCVDIAYRFLCSSLFNIRQNHQSAIHYSFIQNVIRRGIQKIKSKYFSIPRSPISERAMLLLDGPTLRPFVLLIRSVLGWRWALALTGDCRMSCPL